MPRARALHGGGSWPGLGAERSCCLCAGTVLLLQVQYDPSRVTVVELRDAIEDSGFDAHLAGEEQQPGGAYEAFPLLRAPRKGSLL